MHFERTESFFKNLANEDRNGNSYLAFAISNACYASCLNGGYIYAS